MLNNEYPFKLSFLLNLEDEPDGEEFRGNKRSGRQLITRLPRIGAGNQSFDYGKFTEI